MRDATKQISKGPSSWDLSPNCQFPPPPSLSLSYCCFFELESQLEVGKKGKTLSAKNCGTVYCKSSLQCKCCKLVVLRGTSTKKSGTGRRRRRGVTRETAAPYLKSPLFCAIFAGTCLIIKCEKCLHTFRLTLMKRR